MIDRHAFVAATRFGMGLGPSDGDHMGTDIKGWLIGQLQPQPMPPLLAVLPGTADLYQQFRAVQAARKAAKQTADAVAPPTSPAPGEPIGAKPVDPFLGRTPRRMHLDTTATGLGAAPPARPPTQPKPQTVAAVTPVMGEPLREIYVGEAASRTRAAVLSAVPLHERLVQFWSNHFTVSVARPQILAIAGAFEREAIRPHVSGNFHDMLRAVAMHPAMLLYLDNAESLGPDSVAGRRRKKGINENLAREMLELHTLGVDGGYTQADVTNFASVLTGWTLGRRNDDVLGEFLFEPRMHQPGDKRLLSMTIRDGGQDEGERMLEFLAHHPSTAHHIATKLVRHFISDDPPPAAVEAVAASYRTSGGNLAAVMKTVISRPEAWDPPLAKMRTPNDLVIATLRALGDPSVDDKQIFRSLAMLGQAPWSAPSPAGWPDRSDAWMGPEALMRRLQWADIVARKAGRIDAMALAELTIGPVMSDDTRAVISGARDPHDKILMVLASREFERR